MQFIKKPETIDAIQYTEDNVAVCEKMLWGHGCFTRRSHVDLLFYNKTGSTGACEVQQPGTYLVYIPESKRFEVTSQLMFEAMYDPVPEVKDRATEQKLSPIWSDITDLEVGRLVQVMVGPYMHRGVIIVNNPSLTNIGHVEKYCVSISDGFGKFHYLSLKPSHVITFVADALASEVD